jgi:hypothetical protein
VTRSVFYGYFPKWQFKRNHPQSVVQLAVFTTILLCNAVTLSRICISEARTSNIEKQFLKLLPLILVYGVFVLFVTAKIKLYNAVLFECNFIVYLTQTKH